MPIVSIRHQTTYRYRNPVAFGEHRMMLRPLEGPDQRVVAYDLEVSPAPSLLRCQQDVTDAWVAVARFDTRADRLAVESRVVVDHRPLTAAAWDGAEAAIGSGPFVYAAEDAAHLAPSILRAGTASGEVDAWTRRFLRRAGRTRVAGLLFEMTHAIRGSFDYHLRLSGAPQSPVETLASRRGSCRDFAVLMVDAARSLGLAARFVSGYIYGRSSEEGGKGGGHTHAWARVFLPEGGWLDFDPTNGIVGGAGLIRVAVAVDPRAALPLHGAWRGLRSDYLGMDVSVEIAARDEDARQLSAALRVGGTG